MPLIHDDINTVLHLMLTGKLKFNVCEISKDAGLSFESHMYKQSASDSEVFFASLLQAPNSEKVAIKVWVDWGRLSQDEFDQLITANGLDMDDARNNALSMNYEKSVYEMVTEMFLKPGYSNNFIPFIAFATCSYDNILASIDRDPKFKSLHKKLNRKEFRNFSSVLGLNFLVTGTGKRMVPLFDLLDRNLIKRELGLNEKKEIRSIIFQVLYALYLMQRVELIHNDFHLGNILIEILDSATDVTILNATFRTRLIPRIFDWDLSYCSQLGDNPKFNDRWADYMHLGNHFRKGSDYYQFICGLSERLPNYSDFFKGVVPYPDFKYFTLKQRKRSIALPPAFIAFLNDSITQGAAEEINITTYLIDVEFSDFKRLYPSFDADAFFGFLDLADAFNNNKDDDILKFMFNPVTSEASMLTDAVFMYRINATQVNFLTDTIVDELLRPAENDYFYFNIPKGTFFKEFPMFDPNVVFASSQSYLEKFNKAGSIYFAWMEGTDVIRFESGFNCYPIFDDSALLFDLEDLFNPSSQLFEDLINPLDLVNVDRGKRRTRSASSTGRKRR